MSLLALPNELLLLIAEHVQTEKKLYFFLRANRRLYNLLLEYLYQHNVDHHSAYCLAMTSHSDT
jgi:hypothetical protein